MNALNRNPCDEKEIARCMNLENRTLSFLPGPTPNTVRSADGKVFTAPKNWALLPPGDAALTRRIKAAGDCWVVAEKRAEKSFQKVSGHRHARLTGFELNSKLKDPQSRFSKRKAAVAKRRDAVQAEYVEDFTGAVLEFLAFHSSHADLARRALARVVADHATPVGSGTVARTKRIPVEKRAEAAAIAWLRHQTTAYDSMSIPRVKGKREVRRTLSKRSHALLDAYRCGAAGTSPVSTPASSCS